METTDVDSTLVQHSAPEIPPNEFETIQRLLACRTGFHLDGYKDKCIKRRINIRIRATHSLDAADYCRLLARDDLEPARLFKVLTIHVSQFFRNPSTFGKLREETIPTLFVRARLEGRKTLTFWSVGCSTGEEPYTLALILAEYFKDHMGQRPVRLLATDVNAEVLEVARRGAYDPARLAEVPPDMLSRYFTLESGKMSLVPEVRELVEFRQGDLLSNEPLPLCDLILCRNVMIYFERSQQEKLLKGFADALTGGGVLVLGKSETMTAESRKRFQSICPVERIYRAL